jgi:hypothetical protein
MPESRDGGTASFRVHGSFVLRSRALFVLRGIVTGGSVVVGQRVVQPDGIDAPVMGVEAGLSDMSGGARQTALTFRYTSPAELARWQAAAPEGTVLTLSGAPS